MSGDEPSPPALEYRNETVDKDGVVRVEVRCPDHDAYCEVALKKDAAVVASIPVGLKAGQWCKLRSDMVTYSAAPRKPTG